jgi:hypothetical protein
MGAEIRVFSPDLTLLTTIDNFESLIFTRNYYKSSEFQIVMNYNSIGTEYLQKNNIIMINNNPFKTGIIKYREPIKDEKGIQKITVKGFTLNKILSQREIYPSNNKNYEAKDTAPETIIKTLIDTSCVNPINLDRTIPLLEITEDQKRGDIINWTSNFATNLEEELDDLHIVSNLGSRIYLDFNKNKYIYDVYKGEDRSVGNSFGNNPVVISQKFDNVLAEKHIDSLIGYKNVCYAYKKETTTDDSGNEIIKKITIEQVGNAKGLERVEMSYNFDAKGLTEAEQRKELTEEGDKQLTLNQKVDMVEIDVLPYNSFIFEKDYHLGDIVSYVNEQWNISKDLRITEVTEVWETNDIKVNLVLGKQIPTLPEKLKQKLKEK